MAVAAPARPCLAAHSRYCRESLLYPSPSVHPEQFTDWLKETLRSGSYDLLIPMTDISTAMVSRVRADLPQDTQVVIPPPDALEAMLDKASLLKMAAEAGVPVPKTWGIDACEAPPVVSTNEYPVVIKSRRSFEIIGGRWVDGGVRVVSCESDMPDAYASIHSRTPFPLVQEYIPGWGEGLFLLCNHGKLRATFAHRRIRESPPGGGVSTLRESVPVDQSLLSSVVPLLEKLEWHGAAMFEFRVDRRDGVPKLMEVNPRFWGSLHLAMISGQDFPWML
jgi:predicted ATP-grasp superfamily ATP-dependent carboligase